MSAQRQVGVYQPRSRQAQFAEAVATIRGLAANLLSTAVRRGIGAALIVFAAAILAALATYGSGDPSSNVATSREATNALGTSGAYGAALLFEVMGVTALLLPLPIAAWGWKLMTRRHFRQFHWRLPALLLGLLFLAGGLGGFPAIPTLPAGTGGIVGGIAMFLNSKVATAFGSPLISLAIHALFAAFGIVLIFVSGGIGWRSVNAFARMSYRTARVLGRRLNWAFRRKSATAGAASEEEWEETEDDEEDGWEDDTDAEELAAEPDGERDDFPTPRDKNEKRVQRSDDKAKKTKIKSRLQPALNLAEGEYQLPPLSLLSEPPAETGAPAYSDDALEENARLLEAVLGDFGVRGRIVAVRPGPVVTLYELEPAAGVKSSRVISLADDIARSMSAVAARVAVIPGRNVIGIELPNQKRETVYLRELFSATEYEKSSAPLTLALGKTIGGEPVMADLAKMPHLLIAGTTGSGKSVALNTMILSILYRMPPEICRIIMIDPKMLELSVYEGIPHLLAPVVIDPKKAVVALKWAVREMESRYGKMAKIGVRGVEAFNDRVKKAAAKGEVMKRTVQTGFDRESGRPVYEDEVLELEPMPYIVVVVDEMADLMMISGKEIEGAVQRLAQMARAAGIHLIAATQRPSVDVITGTIKANFPTRISFQVTSKIDSRTILGEQGAEQLLGQGDMLYMMAGGRIRRVHGPYVTDSEVEDVVRFLKTQGHPEYLEAVTEEPEEDEDDPYGLDGDGGSGDELLDKAVAIVARERKVSTSYIQRRLQIGYNRAARLIERMEEDGMISKPNHQGKREILLPEHQ